MLVGNIGEWSEIYALFKLISDGVIYSADESLNRTNAYFIVLKAIRKELELDREYSIEDEIIRISTSSSDNAIQRSKSEFAEYTRLLLNELITAKREKKGVFNLPSIQAFLDTIDIRKLKAKSVEKADIHLFLHDISTGLEDLFGFSIKSNLGAQPTLFNSSMASNFIYKICGRALIQSEIDSFNRIKEFKAKFDYLHSLNCYIEFIRAESDVFNDNLIYLFESLPQILGKLVYKGYSENNRNIRELTELIAPEIITSSQNKYKYTKRRICGFLMSSALGMVAAKEWNGEEEANGGYIIVKEDGDIVCYHIYKRDMFANYLFTNTKLETPSTSRYHFGNIYEEDGIQKIKLNFQIRFTK